MLLKLVVGHANVLDEVEFFLFGLWDLVRIVTIFEELLLEKEIMLNVKPRKKLFKAFVVLEYTGITQYLKVNILRDDVHVILVKELREEMCF